MLTKETGRGFVGAISNYKGGVGKTMTCVSCLKKGGVSRPAGYELPQERQARISREAREAREKAEAEMLAEEEKQLFEETLKDSTQVEALVQEIEKNFMTPKKRAIVVKYRETGMVSEMLKQALRKEFLRE
jgi:shikimate 5-dehydrogenase